MKLKIMVLFLMAAWILTALFGCGQKKTGAAGQEADGVQAVAADSDADMSGAAAAEGDTQTQGLPAGFPTDVPLYRGAQILDADTYGEGGYTVVYSVKASYQDVLQYYMDYFSLDESGAGEGTAYFEGIDIGNVHINGLTIEDADGSTQVYITLHDTSEGGGGADAGVYDDAYADDDAADEEQLAYDSAPEVTLDETYPRDAVPIYPSAKVINCSLVPDGSGSGFVDLLLPSDAYDDAVAYYKDALGLAETKYQSQVMVSATFQGEVKGYHATVVIGQAIGSDPYVTIALSK